MRARAVLGLAVACAVALAGASAVGQRVEPRRARTIVVGAPAGPAPADRVDSARSGGARTLLPTGTLHVAWRRNLGLPIEAPPLVDGRGDVTILTARGDLVVLAPDGEERSHTAVGAASVGPAALLSDGTAAFLTSGNDVVGVRLASVRFRTHIGGGRSAVSPLALDDGGFVVATQSELVALDGEGNVRARAAVDAEDAPAHALLGGRAVDGFTVYAVTASGAVLAWVPASGRETTRVGSFGGSTDGSATLVGAGATSALVAVVGSQLVALDVARGTLTTRAAAASTGTLVLLGPPSSGAAGVVSLLGLTASRTVALAFDGAGAEVLHQAVAPTILPSLPDGGIGLGQVPAHVGTLVDPRGDLAFALPSGELGVVSPAGSVDVIGDVCSRFGSPSALATLGIRGGPTYAGLAPAAPSALVVACGSGVVARIDSDFAHTP